MSQNGLYTRKIDYLLYRKTTKQIKTIVCVKGDIFQTGGIRYAAEKLGEKPGTVLIRHCSQTTPEACPTFQRLATV